MNNTEESILSEFILDRYLDALDDLQLDKGMNNDDKIYRQFLDLLRPISEMLRTNNCNE